MKNIDPNPYSTHSARGLWQDGFDGKPLSPFDAPDSFNGRAWQKGRDARLKQNKED